ATEWNQCEVSRIVSALNRDVTQRALHVCRHNVKQTMCGVDRGYFAFHRDAQFGSEMIESFTCAHLIQFEFASQQRRAGKMSEYYVRVSNCRQTRPAIAS